MTKVDFIKRLSQDTDSLAPLLDMGHMAERVYKPIAPGMYLFDIDFRDLQLCDAPIMQAIKQELTLQSS
jgi:hypothetical protein